MPTADETDHPQLAAAARDALAASPARTLVLEHDGARYVVKRLADRPRSALQAHVVRWLARVMTGQTLPMHTLKLSEASASVDFEVRRLRSLAQAGVRVPRVFHHGDGFIVMEHCGDAVGYLIGDWPIETCRTELAGLAAELGAFHRAGQWHGAAQAKNLTRRDGLTWRIDFEENFGELVPLAAAQALDVVLFLNSVSLAGPIDEDEARNLLPKLLHAYFVANPDPQIRALLAQARPWGRALSWLVAPLRLVSRIGRRRKGLARPALLVAALDQELARPAGPEVR